jgi:Na+/melibiose symporter and related transporters
MIVFIFLTGLTLGIFLVVQTTLIADAVDDVERRTGVRNDGISFATLTFSAKIMGASPCSSPGFRRAGRLPRRRAHHP